VDLTNEVTIVCPACNSPALYRYGHAHGAQRYICLMCSRQFVPGRERIFPKSRPLCPHCGRSMYLFRSKERHDTFRCARYPECRTYLRV
jgi:transposase-like protein